MESESITGRRVLVADDDTDILCLISEILTLMGFEVATACNGIEALSAFLAGAFDLVLTDMEMPHMDGWNLAVRVKDKSPSTPIILITGADREAVGRKMKGASIDSVLFKPFMMEEFQSTVQRALSRDCG